MVSLLNRAISRDETLIRNMNDSILAWKDLADSALTQEDRDTLWGGADYYFVLGKLLCLTTAGHLCYVTILM